MQQKREYLFLDLIPLYNLSIERQQIFAPGGKKSLCNSVEIRFKDSQFS